jgi:Domain of unknown function (DUF4326)
MEQNKTVIVNLHHNKRCDIYCDRRSIFGNPYDYIKLGITRDEACELFIPYFKNKLTNPAFRAKVLELKGKILGCWCQCNPPCTNSKCKHYRCHLETIVKFLDNET